MPKRPIRLIINADDYGRSIKVNNAIENGIKAGVITSTTVMTNMSEASEAKKLEALFSTISIGLHVNLTEGRPILPPELIPSLVNQQGLFVGWHNFVWKLWVGQIRRKEMELEITAQLETLMRILDNVSHLDSHQHIHVFPQVCSIMLRVGQKVGLSKIRTNNRFLANISDDELSSSQLWFKHFRAIPLSVPGLALKFIQQWLISRYNFTAPDYLLTPIPAIVPVSTSSAFKAWSIALKQIPQGIYEINCHPGLFAGEEELFSNPKLRQIIAETDISLVNYHQISDV